MAEGRGLGLRRPGRGHDVDYWATWLAALRAVDPDMLVNIEHEEVSLAVSSRNEPE